MTEGRRYKVLGTVGKGGFGTVYKAELMGEGGFSKLVALKVLNADMEEVNEVAIRLRDEARVLGLLRHRAIVQVDGLVRLNDRWTVVMEYVEGADLKQVNSACDVPVCPALTIVEETAGALHAAYTRLGPGGQPLKLLHRDIKPSNIQVTAAGETKLLDFGVARAEFGGREAETRSLMFGSVGYMSPERLDAVDGPAGDVYALGCVLYEMLTGEAFGKTSSKEQRHAASLNSALDRLKQAGVDPDVVRFVEELMAYEPEHRPSARDVERRAAELRAKAARPTLRDWAEELIPPLIGQRPDIIDDLSGSILVEHGSASVGAADRMATPPPAPVMPSDSGARSAPRRAPPRLVAPPPPAAEPTLKTQLPQPPSIEPPASGGRTLRVAAVAVVLGLGLLGLVVVTGGAWAVWGGGGSDAQAPVAVTTAPAVAPQVAEVPVPPPVAVAPEPALETVGRPEPAAPRQPAAAPPATATTAPKSTHVDPAPTSATIARPVETPPAASSTAPGTPAPATATTTTGGSAHFSLSGDARSVALASGGKSYPPGDLPAGAYSIRAVFGDSEPVAAGNVQLIPGQNVVVNCSAVFTRCSVK